MPENDDKHYELESHEEPDDELRAELEPHEPARSDVHGAHGDIHELDICPNCGATMRGSDELVCMRCGFDLKTGKVLETRHATESVDDEDAVLEEHPPISQPGRGDLWLPGAVAALCIVLLIIAYAGGVAAYYEGAEAPNFGQRLVGIAQFLVRLAVWTGCAVGALWATARIVNQQPLGEIRLVLVRLLASVAAINLIRFINFEQETWELGLELVLQAAAFPLMLLAFFGMALRDAATTAVITIGALLAMVLAPLIVSWSM